MKKLEGIIGGKINSWGGIDVNYRPSGFNVAADGRISQGYQDTGCRIMNNGNIRDNYYQDTRLSVNRFGMIGRRY